MKIYNCYIRPEEDGSISYRINPPENEGWIITDTVCIVAEPGYILFHNGVCYGADIADVQDITGWEEYPDTSDR